MKNGKETIGIKLRVDKLFKDLSSFQRLLIMCKLFSWMVTSRIRIERPRARVHWIGANHRTRRHERALLIALFVMFFFVATLVFEPLEYMLWAIVWGGLFSFGVNLYIGYLLLSRSHGAWSK